MSVLTSESPAEQHRRIQARGRLVALIEDQVVRDGQSRVSMLGAERYDDPPLHPIAEAALMLHEVSTRGRAPEPPATFHGELMKMAERRGFKTLQDPIALDLVIYEEPVRMECPDCNGSGRSREVKYQHLSFDSMDLGVICEEVVCEHCKGLRQIVARPSQVKQDAAPLL